ncbi:MAG: hypothetical protein ABJA69_07415 [Acidobacteriaceae bacterium]
MTLRFDGVALQAARFGLGGHTPTLSRVRLIAKVPLVTFDRAKKCVIA